MRVSVAEAKGQLAELGVAPRLATRVVLTCLGHAAVRLVPIKATQDRKSRRALLDAARTSGASRVTSGPTAARSQDFLNGDDGLDVTSKPPGCV
jgi:antitoxin (DNA-binding transcriptional repressor) of toxin-antitoxin stability system